MHTIKFKKNLKTRKKGGKKEGRKEKEKEGEPVRLASTGSKISLLNYFKNASSTWLFLFCSLAVLGTKLRASCFVSKCFTTQLQPQAREH